MIYVAVAESVALVAVAVVGVSIARVLRAIFHEQARRQAELVNQVLHLSGRTWQPPPAEEPVAFNDGREMVLVDPDQEPDY